MLKLKLYYLKSDIMTYKEPQITGKERIIEIKSIIPIDEFTCLITDYESPLPFPILFKQLILN